MRTTLPRSLVLLAPAATSPALAQPFAIDWYAVSAGGSEVASGSYALRSVIGQAIAGPSASGGFGLHSGFLVEFGGACYANCDNSTASPVLNVSDFTCFLQQYANGTGYANCDGSTAAPVLNVSDFTCFLQQYAAGCQ